MLFYTAGGAVRDLLLGRPLRDADYSFAGPTDAFILCYPAARKTKEAPHPIYLLNGQEYSPLPPDLEPELALAEDLRRRDFTINALLLSDNGVLHAHPLALADLRAGLIRPASATALQKDPVRVFRAARFAACLPGFRLHEDTLAQMRGLESSASLSAIAAEQVGGEVRKACLGDAPGDFLRSLHRGGCLTPWFAEFSRAADIPAGPPRYHDSNVLSHTARVMDSCARLCAENGISGKERALAVWMALCHDIGKNVTDPAILPHHYKHENAGEPLARALGERLRLPALHIKAGALAARLHMKAGRYSELRPGTRVDLLMPLHNAGLLRPFSLMAASDSGATSGPDALPRLMARDCERILSVSLPEEWRNRGRASGDRLREMRALSLAAETADKILEGALPPQTPPAGE